MKKLILISSLITMTYSVTGCHTMNDAMNNTSNFANATVGTGIKYTATTVGTGVGLVSRTGAAIGNGVGSVVNTGVGFVGGRPASYQQNKYNTKAQMMYRNGHHYMNKNGKYVRID